MTRRNFILLAIILLIIVIGVFIFLFLGQSPATPEGNSTGTNFGSIFTPFGNNTATTCNDTKATNYGKALPCTYNTSTQTCTDTTATNYGGELPCTYTPAPNIKLKKVSSIPIAGYVVFSDERLKAIPVVTPNGTPTTNSSTTPSGTNTTQNTTGTTGIQKTTKPTPPPTEFAPALRYVDRATGNIYETFADTINETQFTNTVIPRVHDAYFGNKCQTVAMRYLGDDGKTIETFIGSLPKEILGDDSTNINQLKGSFLPENITQFNVSPDTTKLFYLFNLGENDTSAGMTTDSLGNKKVQVFSSPFTEWTSWWPNSSMITLTTKPSTGVPGYMYTVNPDKKDLNKILGNINGLTTLTSPNGKLVLYSDNNLSLNIYNISTNQTNPTGLKTLSEKCTWNKTSDAIYCAVPNSIDQTGYPDIWYQGVVSFTDDIWKINITDGTTSLISDPSSEKGTNIDGIKLALDDNGNYLFFINKKDSYLWELNLN